jgi:hypothetical protein
MGTDDASEQAYAPPVAVPQAAFPPGPARALPDAEHSLSGDGHPAVFGQRDARQLQDLQVRAAHRTWAPQRHLNAGAAATTHRAGCAGADAGI